MIFCYTDIVLVERVSHQKTGQGSTHLSNVKLEAQWRLSHQFCLFPETCLGHPHSQCPATEPDEHQVTARGDLPTMKRRGLCRRLQMSGLLVGAVYCSILMYSFS